VRLADVHFGPDVEGEGVQRQTIRAIVIAASVFVNFGFDCWVTSLVRKDDVDSLHAYGMAADFDSSRDVSDSRFRLMRDVIALRLGDNYDVVYHKGHVHVEYDATGKDIELHRDGNRIR